MKIVKHKNMCFLIVDGLVKKEIWPFLKNSVYKIILAKISLVYFAMKNWTLYWDTWIGTSIRNGERATNNWTR